MLIEDSRDAAALIEVSRATCLDDLDALLEKDGGRATLQFVGYVKEKGLLPEERPAPPLGNLRLDRASVPSEAGARMLQEDMLAKIYRTSEEKGPRGDSQGLLL